MLDDVFIKMFTALNVEITSNGGEESVRIQVYKGLLDQP